MHSIIKNTSKVLALSVLSTIFSPSFVLATKPKRNFKAQTTKVKSTKTNFKTLFEGELERFKQLGENRHFKVECGFEKQGNYQAAYLMLKQLNDLFTDYPNVLAAFLQYCQKLGSSFTLKKEVSPMGNTVVGGGVSLGMDEMSLYTPPAGADIGYGFRQGMNAPVDTDKYLQAIVCHEFGHLMSFLECFRRRVNAGYKLTTLAKILPDDYDRISQEVRDAIARKCGQAPYISHYANNAYRLGSSLLPAPLKPGGDLSLPARERVDREYFAELFAYTHCNSNAPTSLKTALQDELATWFPPLPPEE